MTDSAAQPLRGVGVLVTRPAAQAESLCTRIEAAGGRAIRCPTLVIENLPVSNQLRQQAAQAASADWVIFISANAVTAFHQGGFASPSIGVAAVGRATATALHKIGLKTTIQPAARFDSEGLLELPELNRVANQRIVIVRGEGGRDLLAQTLTQRGAQVEYLELYRRTLPNHLAMNLNADWEELGVDVVVATSNAVLNNLHELLQTKGRQQLARSPLVVVSDRMLQLAQQLGLQGEQIRAADPTDKEVVSTLLQWAEKRRIKR